MNKIKVSVIIPIYNVEKYIEGCLQSICKQTLKDIEIICVNDGTPDNSMKIVEKLAKKDKRIIIINKENGGQSSARNLGIEKAKGKYVYFIDSDDQLKENALEVLYNRMEEDDLVTLFFDAENIYESEEIKEASFFNASYYQRKNDYSSIYTGQELFKEMRNNAEFRVSPCLQMNRLDFINDNKIRFVEGIIHEDEIFTINVCLLSKRVSHIKENFYLRLVRDESTMTTSKSLKRAYGYFRALVECTELVFKYADPDYILAFKGQLSELQNSAATHYRTLYNNQNLMEKKQEEMAFKKSMTPEERTQFELLVEKYALSQYRLEEAKEKIRVQDSIKFLIKKRLTKYRKKFKGFFKGKFKNIANKITGRRYVSVIIAVYNCEQYLRECLDSLLNQSLKNIEIICVDDESTDSSYEILQEYAKKDKRVRVFQQEHSNAGNARNVGIANAKGEYLLFLDSDDFFDKDLCKTTYYYANNFNLDILLFNAYRYDNETGQTSKYQTLLNTDFIIPKEVFSAYDLRKHLYHATSSCPWTKLFSRKFVMENHMEYQPLPNSNDVYFTRTSLALAKRLMAINEKLVYYRVNQKSNTQSKKHKNPLMFIEAYKKVRERLEKEGVFQDFYQTYLNVLITETVYNYKSTNTKEAKEEIVSYLKKKGLKELAIDNIDESLIYSIERYEEFKEIMK